MNAQEFANSIEFPCFFYAGNGSPAGTTIAILPETVLPVDLDELTGDVTDGTFECNNLTCGPGAYDWKFTDVSGSLIYRIQVFSDEKTWEREYAEWMGE